MKKLILLLLPLVTFPSSAGILETEASLIATQLRMISTQYQNLGYSFGQHEVKSDTLWQGQSNTFNIKLRAGKQYKIIAACDSDCKDLDLILRDENGNEISKDSSTDSIPIVSVAPKRTATFTLRANMAQCDNSPCLYSIVTLAK